MRIKNKLTVKLGKNGKLFPWLSLCKAKIEQCLEGSIKDNRLKHVKIMYLVFSEVHS